VVVGGRRPTTNSGWRYAPTIGSTPQISHTPRPRPPAHRTRLCHTEYYAPAPTLHTRAPLYHRATLQHRAHAYTQRPRLYAIRPAPTQADRMPMRNLGEIAQSHADPRKRATPIRNLAMPLRNPVHRVPIRTADIPRCYPRIP
jgi:hypothetical protein